MFKTVLTLSRGAAAAVEEDVGDRRALLILDQQIRDAAAATARGKNALALAPPAALIFMSTENG